MSGCLWLGSGSRVEGCRASVLFCFCSNWESCRARVPELLVWGAVGCALPVLVGADFGVSRRAKRRIFLLGQGGLDVLCGSEDG